MKLVVDTDKKEVIRSPDGDLRFGEYTGHTLTVEYEEQADRHMGACRLNRSLWMEKGKA